MSEVTLTSNQYGKAENRVVRIVRDTDRPRIRDLNVTSQLRGDFEAAHTEGDNGHVVATDTQKNTIFAFAKDGIASPEELLVRLADHFTSGFDWVTGGRWAAEEYLWSGSRTTTTRSTAAVPRPAPPSSCATGTTPPSSRASTD